MSFIINSTAVRILSTLQYLLCLFPYLGIAFVILVLVNRSVLRRTPSNAAGHPVQSLASSVTGTVSLPKDLAGPPSPSFLTGVITELTISSDPKLLYDAWAKTYGFIYSIPSIFGSKTVIVCDANIAQQIFNKDTYGYVKPSGLRMLIAGLAGKGLLWAEGDLHRRQRRALNPAFGAGAIRQMTPVFYDAVERLKSNWENIIDTHGEGYKAPIEMNYWLTKLSLDTIGLGAFSHSFGALAGDYSGVEEALTDFNLSIPSKIDIVTFVLSIIIPAFNRIPTRRNKMFHNLSAESNRILDRLVEERKSDYDSEKGSPSGRPKGKSLVEMMIDYELRNGTDISSIESRKDEIVAQVKGILIAGSDPPGVLIVWALIELARHPEMQNRLREEILSSTQGDQELDYIQLQKAFPYLDAIMSETLRLHHAVGETPRVAAQDDVYRLKEPIFDTSGRLTDTVLIPIGTNLIVPNHSLNISEAVWGADALQFNPERWITMPELLLDSEGNNDDKASAAPSSRRLWTFGSGPRICLGRLFALTQMKIVLSSLIRDFIFELPHGQDTNIGLHLSLVPRPKLEGEEGAIMPLVVSRAR